MKHFFSITLVLILAISQLPAATYPSSITVPNVGNGRLKVCGQNMHNYFLNFENSFSDSQNITQLQAKTRKIVNAFLTMDADIYALCELECSDTIVGYLTAAMNSQAGANSCAYVHDQLEDSSDGITKVGFVYKKATVRPVTAKSKSSSGSDNSTYGKRMRWIGFEEICSGEKFVLSMNHFKAKVNSDDQGNAQRVTNATNLCNAMTTMRKTDPDIIVLGDLNCTTDEEPIQNLITTGGLSEQLERFNSSAYSYYYSGSYQLIDHAMANSTAASQITGAGVFHVNTGTNKNGSYWYSDHDLYMLAMNLGNWQPTPDPEPEPEEPILPPCDDIDTVWDFRQSLTSIGWTNVSVSGTASWSTSATYGATISGYNKTGAQENWLISPVVNLADKRSATLTLNHNIYYNNGDDYTQHQVLMASYDYVTGDPNIAHWTQLPLSAYQVKGYVNATATVPASLMSTGIRFALRYTGTSNTTSNYWEVKTLRLEAECAYTSTEQLDVKVETSPLRAMKVMIGGELLIVVDEQVYDVMGRRVK